MATINHPDDMFTDAEKYEPCPCCHAEDDCPCEFVQDEDEEHRCLEHEW